MDIKGTEAQRRLAKHFTQEEVGIITEILKADDLCPTCGNLIDDGTCWGCFESPIEDWGDEDD